MKTFWTSASGSISHGGIRGQRAHLPTRHVAFEPKVPQTLRRSVQMMGCPADHSLTLVPIGIQSASE